MTEIATSAPKNTASKPVVGVGIVIIRPGAEGQEVLLIRRGRPPGVGIWSIPGGHLEFGETVRQAAAREALEETGLTIGNLRLIDVVDVFVPKPDGGISTHWTLVDFRADWTGGEAVAGDDAAAVAWVPVDEIAKHGLWAETARVITAGAALT